MSFELLLVMPRVSRALRHREYSQARDLLLTVIPSADMVSRALAALIATEPAPWPAPNTKRDRKGPQLNG